MKRDPDLERQILLAIEDDDAVSGPHHAEVRHLASTPLEADYHALLLWEAGLIVAVDACTKNNPFPAEDAAKIYRR